MEDASAVDLDWFFRGWFYSTDFVDIGINDVKHMSLKQLLKSFKVRTFRTRSRISALKKIIYQTKSVTADENIRLQETLFEERDNLKIT
jgi:hypothetical protein